jgi:hypothetical protein
MQISALHTIQALAGDHQRHGTAPMVALQLLASLEDRLRRSED